MISGGHRHTPQDGQGREGRDNCSIIMFTIIPIIHGHWQILIVLKKQLQLQHSLRMHFLQAIELEVHTLICRQYYINTDITFIIDLRDDDYDDDDVVGLGSQSSLPTCTTITLTTPTDDGKLIMEIDNKMLTVMIVCTLYRFTYVVT